MQTAFRVVVLAGIFGMFPGGAGLALDDGYCGRYADNAVEQTKTYQSRACTNPGNSQWWSTSRDYHMNWCKTLADNTLSEKGTADRQAILNECGAKPTKDAKCADLIQQESAPTVCHWDFARDKTVAEACSLIRNMERTERVGQAAALASHELLSQMAAEIEAYIIVKEEEAESALAWKVFVSSSFFLTGLWAGPAMEAAGLSFGQQLLAGIGMTMIEEEVEKLQWNAAIDALTTIDWKDGAASDAASPLVAEMLKRKLTYEFSKSLPAEAAARNAESLVRSVGPMFALFDAVRRYAKYARDARELSPEVARRLLGDIQLMTAQNSGYFDAHTKNRKLWLGYLQESGCQ